MFVYPLSAARMANSLSCRSPLAELSCVVITAGKNGPIDGTQDLMSAAVSAWIFHKPFSTEEIMRGMGIFHGAGANFRPLDRIETSG